jgi:hypothetical protein
VGASAPGDGELLPEEQVLEHERLAATERGTQRAEEEHHPVRHGTMMARGADRHPDGALAPYTPTPRRIRQQCRMRGRRTTVHEKGGTLVHRVGQCRRAGLTLVP